MSSVLARGRQLRRATRTCSRFRSERLRGDLYSPRRGRRCARGVMATRIRLFAAFGALVTAVVLVLQGGPLTVQTPDPVQLRSTFAPLPMATTTIKWPVIETVDPDPFDACRDIPL